MDIPFQTCDRLRAEFAHRRLPPKIAQAKCRRHGRSRQTRAHSATLGSSPFRYPATPRLRLRGRSVDAMYFLRRPFVPCPVQRASNARRAPSPRRSKIVDLRRLLCKKDLRDRRGELCHVFAEQKINGNREHDDTSLATLAPREPPVDKLGYGLTRTACRDPKRTTKVIGTIWLLAAPQIAAACAWVTS